jgi:DNA-binding MurR/RpiR family transcriptional regulator
MSLVSVQLRLHVGAGAGLAVAAGSYKELEQQLRAGFGDLTPHQQRVAQRVLSDPEGCAFKTITQLAESADVNESTVVRFATSLGLRGYPDLVRLCQQRLQEKAQMVERFNTLSYLESVEGGILGRVAAYDQANIARTFADVDPDAWQRAVTTLRRSRRVLVVGHRKSFAPASLLTYLLGLVRDEVQQVGLGPRELPDVLRRVGPDDAVVALSIHRYVRDSVRTLAVARRMGATTIALTDNAASPLVEHADAVFYVEVGGVTILRSMTAVVSLVQALASAVATELDTDTRASLLLEEQLLEEFDVYLEAPRAPETATTQGRERASRAGG